MSLDKARVMLPPSGMDSYNLENCIKMDRQLRPVSDIIAKNRNLFKDATVLVLRCGLGALAIASAKAGAKCVYAVDVGDVMKEMAEIVQRKGYGDVIKPIRGHVDQIELPVQKVDIIVCMWMGTSLLHESCVDQLLIARDKWLKKDGTLFPDKSALYIRGIVKMPDADEETKENSNVADPDKRWPVKRDIDPRQIITTEFVLHIVDLYKATQQTLAFTKKFWFRVIRSDKMIGLIMYFRTWFRRAEHCPEICTCPHSLSTPHKQVFYPLEQPVPVQEKRFYQGIICMQSIKKSKPSFDNIEVRLRLYKSATSAISWYRRNVRFFLATNHWFHLKAGITKETKDALIRESMESAFFPEEFHQFPEIDIPYISSDSEISETEEEDESESSSDGTE